MKKSKLENKRFTRLKVIKKVNKRGASRYLCLCDCGKECVVDGRSLTRKSTKSCGCLSNEFFRTHNYNGLDLGVSVRNTIIHSYKGNAKAHNRIFCLTTEESCKLFKGNCFYCGLPPSTVGTHSHCRGEYLYNGIDRVDSSLGYTPENCVSCCTMCNYKKRNDKLSDFIKWVRKVHNHTKGLKLK
jgi:hypothetical protein